MRLEAEHSMIEKLMKSDSSKVINPDAKHSAPGFPAAETTSDQRDKSWRQELLAKRAENGADARGKCHGFDPSRSEGDQSPNCAAFMTKPKLALALGSIADEYLGLNILDDDHQTSKYVAFLLDVINALHSRVQFQFQNKPIGLDAKKTEKTENADNTKSTKSTDNTKEKENLPRFKILHRVFCGLSFHNHNGTVYEDIPVLTRGTTGSGLEGNVLSGTNEVSESCLREHPYIDFIVYKEYRCRSICQTF
jgi:hypothetical protein